jgi:hypothetical protein
MVLNTGRFHEKRCRKGRDLLMGENEITFVRVP